MPDNGANIGDVIQILKFGGEVFNVGIKGLKAGGKGLAGANNLRKLIGIKGRLAVYHCKEATAQEFNILKLKTVHKMTGGNYSVIDLPTEDKELLSKFFNHMKKLKIHCALLPDLVPDNGFSQIAVIPEEAERLHALMDIFDFSTGKINKNGVEEENRAKVIDFDEYWGSGNKEIKESLVAEAIDDVEKDLNEIQKKNENPVKSEKLTKEDIEKMAKVEKFKALSRDKANYYQVTIDKKMIIKEDEKTYLTRVPASYDKKTGTAEMMAVSKEDSMLVNKGETILTFLPKNGQTCIARKLDNDTVNKKVYNNSELYSKHYDHFRTDINKQRKRKNSKVLELNKYHKKPGINK